MKASKRRTIVILVTITLITIGHITFYSIGTLSAIGWREFSLLCPLGAIGTMLASKMLVPKALISIVAAVILLALTGRAFCSWVCPVPLVSRIPNIFKKTRQTPKTAAQKHTEAKRVSTDNTKLDDQTGSVIESEDTPVALVKKEKRPLYSLLPKPGSKSPCKSGCSSCEEKRGYIDSRHLILGGALLSAFIFGFPVFCLICPVGLTIGTILLIVQLFAVGETTWTLLLAPAVLAIEVIFFRKWCSVICPLSAVTSLLSKLTLTMKLTIDDKKCLETSKGQKCGACASVCPERIDPRHPERSYSLMCECTKCYECVEICPSKALKIPILSRKGSSFSRVKDRHQGEKD